MPIKRKFMIGVRKKTAKTAIHLNAGFIYSGEVNLRLFYAKVPSRTYTFQTSISHMLEFWFNPQITITKKIALLLVILLVTAALYLLEPLKLDAILMFLAAGLVFLICRYCKIHFTAQHPTGWLARLLTWIPLALLLALIFMQIQHGEILLSGAQGIGFTALAICLFSPLALLHQHHTSDTQ